MDSSKSFTHWNQEDFLHAFGRAQLAVAKAREGEPSDYEKLLKGWGLDLATFDEAGHQYIEATGRSPECQQAFQDGMATFGALLAERPEIVQEVATQVAGATASFAG